MTIPTRVLIGRRAFVFGAMASAMLPACASDTPAADGPPPTGTGAKVPSPAAFVRTSWSTDPWSLGSYSFMAVGAEPAMRAALAAPIDGRLFFAGEATDADDPGTVNGALATGRRVVSEVASNAAAGARVAVIGAGAAGAQAASLLVEDGFEVVVYEARDHMGGRLDTVQPAGWPIPVERGASWVHAVDASDLADRLARLGVATVPFGYEAAMLGANGQPIEDIEAFYDGVETSIEDAVDAAGGRDDDISLAAAIADRPSPGDPTALAHFLSSEIVTEFGADPDEISAWWGLEEGSEGDDELVVGGYVRLVEDLLDGIAVEYEAAVSAITVRDGRVSLTVDDTPIDVDAVVVTVPLGVLKAGTIEFDPPLPGTHLAAIDALGFGVLDKLWLRFDQQFWSNEALMWTLVDDPDFPEWFNLAPVTGEPVLLGLVGGGRARRYAAATDDELVTTALRSLQRLADAGW
ncbi:MAG: FAD-dependent oxidoreductase [Ilumatobacteraceae bacterium]